MSFLKLLALLFIAVSIARLFPYGDKNTIRVFPGHYKIKKIVEDGKLVYYVLYVYKKTFPFFEAYHPVGNYVKDEYIGANHFILYKFNSVQDAENYWESYFLKNS